VLGMIIETYEKKTIPMDTWVIYIFSPIVFPIIIGMMLSEKSKNVEEDE
jgi:hypothetical protein